MKINVDLHLRSNPGEEHRTLGMVAVEHEGPQIAPHADIACQTAGREIHAHITSVHQHGDHLPHVYADTLEMDD
ncbi:MAG TPA: hypothetical protein VHW90_03190 [Stellaceae bacterium]|nr:hypothetical protein [Stellaceae bacterium]